MIETSSQPWSQTGADVAARLQVDLQRGLSQAEAEARLARHGPNVLRSVEVQSAWEILLNQFKSLVVALLGAACLVSVAFEDWVEAGAIAAVLAINTLIGFFTELRAVRSMEALRELGTVQARLRRGGAERHVPAQELVPGDVVILEGGDVVTADLRVVEDSKLEADESVLTGESLPVGKDADALPPGTPLAERRNMLFKGTALTRGSAIAVVVSTGMDTELGKIAALVAEAQDESTPLERRLERLGRRLVVVALAIALIATVGGIASGKDVFLMVETGIALAVAAIPEGLPVVATMALARGMWRLARRDALVRSLAAVETLGETTLILTDKTGTLTENRMTVTRLVLAEGGVVEVSGEGLQLEGAFSQDGERRDPGGSLLAALEVCVLCNDASLQERESGVEGLGDPLEVALLVVGAKGGLRRAALLEQLPEGREEAFDPTLKLMATFHTATGGDVRVAVKGGVEAVLAAASGELRSGGAVPLDPERRAWWSTRNDELAQEGLRVLALATRAVSGLDAEPYHDLTLIGLVAMQDPPRAGVKDAVSACRRAGIRVVMATGDQAPTARTIGVAVGLVDDHRADVVGGPDLEATLADAARLKRTAVFARVDPAQKLTLVEAYQRAGEVVAMTGDGVNDAPALQKADIGVAMGLRGTQVAREAADMVLRDDSLESIVVAIRQGRVIFENIRKFVLYLLSCNLAEIGVIGVATLIGLPLPLLPLQILFLNLLTDVFPALALGFGEGDPAIMQRPPRDPKEPFLNRGHWVEITLYAGLLTAAVLGAMSAAIYVLEVAPAAATAVSFLTLGFAQLWHVFNVRTPGSSFLGNDVLRNPHVWGALALCVGLLLVSAWFAPLAAVLRIPPLDPATWLLMLGCSLAPWLLGQLAHAVRGNPG